MKNLTALIAALILSAPAQASHDVPDRAESAAEPTLSFRRGYSPEGYPFETLWVRAGYDRMTRPVVTLRGSAGMVADSKDCLIADPTLIVCTLPTLGQGTAAVIGTRGVDFVEIDYTRPDQFLSPWHSAITNEIGGGK